MRPQTRTRLMAVGVAVAVLFSAIALIVSLARGGSTTVQQTSDAGPSVGASVSTSAATTVPVLPPAASSASPTATSATSSSTTDVSRHGPLPQGTATPVDAPKDTTPAGVTSGDLSTADNAPDYSVKVMTATVEKHWGFTYSFQCDPNADDTWRAPRPKDGSFSIRLGNNFLVAGNTYEGSGFAEVHSDSGPTTHELVIGGPCSYELHYVSYSN